MEHILSLSYGKDSLACFGAIEELGWPLDRIIHAEVWATDTIPADLPPMVEFKEVAKFIKDEGFGNNETKYSWVAPQGPMSWFGQEVSHWMPLPEPPK